jgi:phosphohistidine swiveling domain-containing protein
MSSLWQAGGSVDLASRALGMNYKVTETGDGHLFQLFDKVYADVTLKSDTALQLPKSLRKDLENRCGQIESHFHHAFLPALHQELEYWNALSFSKLHFKSQLDLVGKVTDYFVNEVYAFAEQINIMASILHQHAASECERQNLDMQKLMQAPMPHAPSQIIARAAELPNEQREKFLLQEMGHRAIFDYELSLPRYSENPEMLWKLGKSNVRPVNFERDAPIANGHDILTPLVERALQFQDLKEHVKHESIRVLSVLRKILCEIDANLGAQGFVFYLTYQEVLGCDESNLQSLISLASQRYVTSQTLKDLAPNQAALSLHDCELLSNPTQKKTLQKVDLQGDYVAGNQNVTGHIYRATEDQELGDADLKGFTSGDILVCNMINPAWLPYILKSKAVICEVGGWLSHMAIVAREHNIPMIVGCTGLERLQHGEQVKVFKTGSIERLTEVSAHIALNTQAR